MKYYTIESNNQFGQKNNMHFLARFSYIPQLHPLFIVGNLQQNAIDNFTPNK